MYKDTVWYFFLRETKMANLFTVLKKIYYENQQEIVDGSYMMTQPPDGKLVTQ
jgi:hypothetical protein